MKRLNIPEGHESTALEGDRVLVRLRRPSASERDPAWLKHLPKDKQEKLRQRFQDEPPRLEGDVIKVLERSARKLVGTLTVGEGWATLAPDDERVCGDCTTIVGNYHSNLRLFRGISLV